MSDNTNDAFTCKQNVDSALEQLRLALTSYVPEKMHKQYGDKWQQMTSIRPSQQTAEPDIYALLKTMNDCWRDVFSENARVRKVRNFIFIALDARNASSHFDGFMENREALRYLDAIINILDAVGAEEQVKRVKTLYETQRQTQPETPAQPEQSAPTAAAAGKLRPWREVAHPHLDVLNSHFTEAEFGADLAFIDQNLNEATLDEPSEQYADPLSFFRITYLTEGLRRVLQRAAERLAKKGGDPVIALQTNFGGGKTHTMLALYHLAAATARGFDTANLHGIKPILDAAAITRLPKVRTAVFSGTHKGPSEIMHASDGRQVTTVWGYLAYRLGGWAAVDTILESETHYTNPGSEHLAAILKTAAPCLILMDEVLAFAKQLQGARYEAFHAFLQSLTEAAAATPGALLVASLPQSEKEVGDDIGAATLTRLEKLFARLHSAWTPASGMETFEIVRRRLFQPLDTDGEKARDATIKAFADLYRKNAADFPPEAKTRAYRDEMQHAYPIHPQVLKHFSEDWSTLEKFQRTRGILKIMANAIYPLWRDQSNEPLITLGSLPLRDDKLRTAILEPLPPAYAPILQKEVDGGMSLPAREETARPRFSANNAMTRATRAVFLATAPHNGAPRAGVNTAALRLACALPHEQFTLFDDALRTLAERAVYLYRDNGRCWFSTQPTLNQAAEQRAQDMDADKVEAEITRILRAEQRQKGKFHRIHAAPDDPADIEDNQGIALVILPPANPFEPKNPQITSATATAKDTLQRRGSGQRQYRNTLIFLAADDRNLETCRDIARKHLAWKAILADREMRENMTNAQQENAKSRADQFEKNLLQRIRATWSHILHPAPETAAENDIATPTGFRLEHLAVINRAPGHPIAPLVYDKLQTADIIIAELGPATLTAELEKIWLPDQPHIQIATLMDWFASYVHLPRLRDQATLTRAIEKLLARMDSPFAFANAFDEASGRYQGVSSLSADLGINIDKGLLVRKSALPPESPPQTTKATPTDDIAATQAPGKSPADTAAPAEREKRPNRFFASIPLNNKTPDSAVEEFRILADDILRELLLPKDAQLHLTLEIDASAPEDYPKDVTDTVRANLRALKLDNKNAGFARE